MSIVTDCRVRASSAWDDDFLTSCTHLMWCFLELPVCFFAHFDGLASTNLKRLSLSVFVGNVTSGSGTSSSVSGVPGSLLTSTFKLPSLHSFTEQSYRRRYACISMDQLMSLDFFDVVNGEMRNCLPPCAPSVLGTSMRVES